MNGHQSFLTGIYTTSHLGSFFIMMLAFATCSLARRHASHPDEAGVFDYYLLALQWTPTYCSSLSADLTSNQGSCAQNRKVGFTLHGIWPQYRANHGYPSYCSSHQPGMTSAQAAAAGKIFASAALARHEWKKHGTCTGLSVQEYVGVARKAVSSVHIPKRFDEPHFNARLSARHVVEEFVAANPAMTREMVRISCVRARLLEVRICLTKQLELMACDPHLRGCSLASIQVDGVGGGGEENPVAWLGELWEALGKVAGGSLAVIVGAVALFLWRWRDWWRRTSAFAPQTHEAQPLLRSYRH